MAVPAMLCVDVEPDVRSLPLPAPLTWTGFEMLCQRAGAVRDLIGGQLTWFLRMDPQIERAYGSAGWVAERYARELRSLTDAGDELGLHPHSYRRDDARDTWVHDHADATWIEDCAATALTAFEEAFGSSCRAYRHGDRFMTAALACQLERAGVDVDLTLEPGMPEAASLHADEPATGVIPAVPPDCVAPFRRDGDRLLSVPLTSSLRLDHGTSGYGTLILWHPPALFSALLEVRLEDPGLTHLAFALRSDLPLHLHRWRWFEENLAHLGRRLPGGLCWMPAGDAAQKLPTPLGDPAWPPPSPSDLAASVPALVSRALEAAALDGVLLRREIDRLTTSIARSNADAADASRRYEELEASLSATQDTLAELRATRTWRAHERVAPVLRRLARLFTRT
jgi:hypothetical protein